MPGLTLLDAPARSLDTSATEEPQAPELPTRMVFLDDDDVANYDVVPGPSVTYGTAGWTAHRANTNVAGIALDVVEAPRIPRLAVPQDPGGAGTLGPSPDVYSLVLGYLVRPGVSVPQATRRSAEPIISTFGVEERVFVRIEAPVRNRYRVKVVAGARAEYRAGYRFPEDI